MSGLKDAPPLRVEIRLLPHAEGLPLPELKTEAAAGHDLCAAISIGDDLTIAPGGRALVPTGLTMALPPGTEAQVRPRSGLALKHGVTVLNTPGTIDADYRGEIRVILVNLGQEPFVIRRGDRIAQMVIQTVPRTQFAIVEELDVTERGTGGFGSTGTSSDKMS